MITTDISIVVDAWETHWPNVSQIIPTLVKSVLERVDQLPQTREIEGSICLAGNGEVQALNALHRGKDKPTNVLSFPGFEFEQLQALTHDGPPILLGDIILAFETVAHEAKTKKIAFRDHATHLLVHGVLHLLGYDHETDRDAAEMEALEIDLLEHLGVGNPYAVTGCID